MVDWLRARLDEDEAVAKAAARRFEEDVAAFKAIRPENWGDGPGESAADWSGGTDEDETGYYRAAVWAGDGITAICEMESEYDQTSPEHIARWDPARVLAEVAAKRRIVELHAHVPPPGYVPGSGIGCQLCSRDTVGGDLQPDGWCETLRLLALPFADRPGYQDSWRPR